MDPDHFVFISLAKAKDRISKTGVFRDYERQDLGKRNLQNEINILIYLYK